SCDQGTNARNHSLILVVEGEIIQICIIINRGSDGIILNQTCSTVTRNGGFNLIHHGVSLLVVDRLRQRQLTHENLSSLRQHALLTCRKPAVLVTAPQVTHYLSDLVDIARSQALLVCLITAGPVSSLFNVYLAQNGEKFFSALFTYDITNANLLYILRGNAYDKVRLIDLQHEVFQHFPAHFAVFNCLNHRRTVVGINNNLADLELHCSSFKIKFCCTCTRCAPQPAALMTGRWPLSSAPSCTAGRDSKIAL